MNDALQIREASVGDAPLVAALLTELNLCVGAGGYAADEAKAPEHAVVTAEQMERRLAAIDGIETVYLAERDGEIVGFTSLRLVPYLDQDEPYAEVMQLYVRPSARRSGIASALMRHAEEIAIDNGATALRVQTSAAPENAEAHAFYRAAGYAPLHYSFEKLLSETKDEAPHA